MTKIVLASTSPRRKELLASAGVDFAVMAVDIDESWRAGESADDYIMRMVDKKSEQAVRLCQHTDSHQHRLIITADTIGVLSDGQVLTKPRDKADAVTMWQKLSDNTHKIWTAVCLTLCDANKVIAKKTIKVSTKVTFIQLTPAKMDAYWQTGEPVDKAGAYAIQGGAAAWVKVIDGSYTNVVGLPLAETLAGIDELLFGLNNTPSL